MKLAHHVCFNKTLDELGNGSCRIKRNGSISKILKKPCLHPRDHIFSLKLMKNRMFAKEFRKNLVFALVATFSVQYS